MNILVTGGAGFIGSAFVRLLLKGIPQFDDLKKITVLDSLTYSGNLDNLAEVSDDKRLEIVVGSINDIAVLSDAAASKNIIFNFAAESHVDRSIDSAELFLNSNIIGAYNVFNQGLKANESRIIQISTDEVYGSVETGLFTEESNLQPNSPYAASKASADLLARSYFKTHNLPIIITRCSNNYGPFQHPEKLIPMSVTNLMRGKKIPIYGNGLNKREWIHVDDHCRAIAQVSRSGKLGDTYNIGGDICIENLDLVRKILKIMNFDDSMIEFVKDRKGHDFRYAMDGLKISKLGFKPEVDFDSELRKLIKWYEHNQSWWKPLVS